MEFKLLDDLLNVIANLNRKSDFNSIQNILRLQYPYRNKISEQVIYRAFRKLRKDGYVTEVKETLSNEMGANTLAVFISYEVSFEGIVFSKFGGYSQETNNQLRRDNQDARNRNQLLFLNIVIALGTLIAGVYYLIQIFYPARQIIKVVLKK
jgi:DNA-binding PadR family transcriptional regulator